MPASILLTPKQARPIADLPDPASPVMPITSPAFTFIDTSSIKLLLKYKFFISSNFLPRCVFISGKRLVILRPVANSTNFCSLILDTESVLTT